MAEIAIDAGLVTKPNAARAGKLAEERRLPLVVVLVRELGVDELALVTAFGKQTRVPLVDPQHIQADPEAVRAIPRDVCARLRVFPLALTAEAGGARVLRLAMADPTDTTAVAEIEALTQCEIDVAALPLSAIDELVARSRRAMFITSENETSVTAQMPMQLLGQPGAGDLESRVGALVQLLISKGVITEAELEAALAKLKS